MLQSSHCFRVSKEQLIINTTSDIKGNKGVYKG